MTKFYIENKTLAYIFTIFFILFSYFIINQYSIILENRDLYRSFLGDGFAHIRLIAQIDNNLTFNKIHPAELYYNNYYLFSLLILKILKIFPGFSYSTIGLAAVIVNLISTYVISIFSYLVCFNLSKSKILSLSMVLLMWNGDLIEYSLYIYPDILQLAFIFISIYFLTTQYKYKFLLSVIFSGLAFGVKAQGLLIFFYLISYIFFIKIQDESFKLKNEVILKVSFYCLTFASSFFILNQVSLKRITEIIFKTSEDFLIEREYSNFDIVNNYLLYILKGEVGLFLLILLTFIGIFISIKKSHNKKILFYFSTIFIILFYLQLVNLYRIVQGPRYLYHLFPLILIVISQSYFFISEFFHKKNIKFISLLISIVFLFLSLNSFYSGYKNSIAKFNFKAKLKNDDMMKAYFFIKNSISFEFENPLVCAGHYSLIPGEISNNIKKSYRHLDFEDLIRSKSCDLIVLDHSTPGRYIWFEKNMENIIIRNYNELNARIKQFGKDNILKTQNLIYYILTNKESGYETVFFNKKMIVLKKIAL